MQSSQAEQVRVREQVARMIENLRTSPRRRVIKQAKVVFGNYMFVLDCYIRDMSEAGARIKIRDTSEVPDEFYLFVPSEYLIFKSVVRWKKDGEIGLEFEGTPRNVLNDSDPRLARFRF